jgi:hypothetical protein
MRQCVHLKGFVSNTIITYCKAKKFVLTFHSLCKLSDNCKQGM